MKLTKEQEQLLYKPATATDVTVRWRQHGWTPPSELAEYKAKWERIKIEARMLPNARLA